MEGRLEEGKPIQVENGAYFKLLLVCNHLSASFKFYYIEYIYSPK